MATQAQPVSQLNPRRSRRRPSRARYDVQHVSETPRGWRVRSVARGDHVIRIAFPPGRRKKGSGRVVEILHPRTNPACEEGSCHERTCNPAELVIFGNPSSRRSKRNAGNANHKANCPCFACKHARRANAISEVPDPDHPGEMRFAPWRVDMLKFISSHWYGGTLSDAEFRYIAREVGMPKGDYDWSFIRDADDEEVRRVYQYIKDRHPEMGPHRGFTPNRNPRRANQEATTETEAAVQLFQTFHGKDPREILRLQQDTSIRKDYTALGDLIALGLDDNGYSEAELTHRWDKCPYLNFSGKGIKLASAPNGKQLYALGGDVNLSSALKDFKDVDTSKDFVDLGEIYFVVYEAEKAHSNFEPVQWVHRFDKAARPVLVYNQIQNAILFAGGEYFIDLREKLSPGIEG